MSFATGATPIWPVPPDWADGVRETLDWLTDYLPARNGKAQKRELRQAPRRVIEFSVINDEQGRRVADAILNDAGGRYWLLPIWHDVQLLNAPLASDATSITCAPAGRDFRAGGKALLWLAVNDWTVLDVEDVVDGALVLSTATSRTWQAGTRLYPLRKAHLVEQPQETIWTDESGTRSIQMLIDEPCDWVAGLPAATYRGVPVLELRPDQGEDLQQTFRRLQEPVDVGTGLVTLFDWGGRAFREASVTWLAYGVEANNELRSLLYGLRGRMQTLWVPTWNNDLKVTNDIAAASTHITVEWAGYTVFGRMQPNRRDIRIELLDGTVYYRRLTDAQESGDSELLTIDSALGVLVQRQNIRQVSFLVLAEKASDTAELLHDTDIEGLTRLTTAFIGVRNDDI